MIAGKFQLIILGKKKRNSVKLTINLTEIEESKKVVLLGITIDALVVHQIINYMHYEE